jgi:membrane protease YdiL (CAAX protease family)
MTIQSHSTSEVPDRGVSAATEGRWPLGSVQRLIHGITLVLFQIILNVVGFSVIAPLLLGPNFEFGGSPMEFVVVAVMGVLGIGLNVGVALCAVGRVAPRQLGWVYDALGKDIAAGLIGACVCALAITGLSALQTGGDGARELWQSVVSYTPGQRLLFLSIGLTAAVYEESLFRGYLQPAIAGRTGVVVAVPLTAAIFALYHLQLHPFALAGKFAVGLVFGALRAARPSLFAPAVAHALVWTVIGAA